MNSPSMFHRRAYSQPDACARWQERQETRSEAVGPLRTVSLFFAWLGSTVEVGGASTERLVRRVHVVSARVHVRMAGGAPTTPGGMPACCCMSVRRAGLGGRLGPGVGARDLSRGDTWK